MVRYLSCLTWMVIAMVAGVSSAADDVFDGFWKWTSEIGQQTIHSTLRLESEGNRLSGTYKDQNVEVEIENGEIDGRNIWFEMNVELEEMMVFVKFDGELVGDEIDGALEVVVNGEEQGEYKWNPQRSVPMEDVLGTWEFEFESPDGVQHTPSLELTERDGELVGKLSNEQGAIDLPEVNLEAGTLAFAYETEYQGSELSLKYVCKPRGNKLTGSIEYNLDGNEGDFEIAATRRALSRSLRAMLGEWEFAIVDPDGNTHDTVLKLLDESGQLNVQLTTKTGEVELTDLVVDSGKVKFNFVNDHNGVSVRLAWETQLDGADKMKGTMEFDVDGNTGEIPLEGSKRK